MPVVAGEGVSTDSFVSFGSAIAVEPAEPTAAARLGCGAGADAGGFCTDVGIGAGAGCAGAPAADAAVYGAENAAGAADARMLLLSVPWNASSFLRSRSSIEPGLSAPSPKLVAPPVLDECDTGWLCRDCGAVASAGVEDAVGTAGGLDSTEAAVSLVSIGACCDAAAAAATAGAAGGNRVAVAVIGAALDTFASESTPRKNLLIRSVLSTSARVAASIGHGAPGAPRFRSVMVVFIRIAPAIAVPPCSFFGSRSTLILSRVWLERIISCPG